MKLSVNLEHLPAYGIAEEVNQRVRSSKRLVITAPPGAGKSTLLPITLLEAVEGKVLMLEPRRLAARTVAERMAHVLGERVGETVGYRIRFENRVSERTRIEVLTEGILTRMLIADPFLEGVGAVIFDEFHERSLAADLALALTREVQETVRDDLRLIIMSATIETKELCQQLGATVIDCPGRMFPVRIEYLPREEESLHPDNVARDVARVILKAHREEEGDLLAFLPGQAEIQRCQQLLEGGLGATHILPLYAMLTPEEQDRAIRPSPPGQRKVVLATNIAETSLTIEGVRLVVDSGLQRKLVFDPRTELSQLQTVPISLDMATQRTGRAGRLTDGVCYRLWSQPSEHRMEAYRKPEVLEADLAHLVLDVAAFDIDHPHHLPWITMPASNLRQAMRLLQDLQATDANGRITPLGRQMARLACHPRMARMLLTARTPEQKALVADIAALLEERDPLKMGANRDTMATSADLNLRLDLLRQHRRKNRNGQLSRLLRISEEYYKMSYQGERMQPYEAASTAHFAPEETGRYVALAFPERIACQQDGIGNYRLANGANVRLEANDELTGSKWLAVAQLNAATGRVFLASPVGEDDLRQMAQPVDRLAWNNKSGQLVCQQEWRLGNLVVDVRPLQASREQLVEALCQAAQTSGESMFDMASKDVQQLQIRVAHVAGWHPELELPQLDTVSVLQRSQDWLPFYLDNNGHLRSDASELRRIDMAEVLWSQLSYEQQQAVERLAPSHVVVPTGSRIRLDYRPGAEAPVLSVRLQECFGLTDTPCVNEGRQPVLMELLSPGFKPVQLTQDLRSFWQDTYFEVRKELRRRYPKHAWPDNPLEADPTRGVKRRS